ncbi:redoxin domain-containing protein [Rhizobium leguminosarum bv. viciae]|uniref:peroxiredoxin-like family protein n=1 Tax=Rhizobium leguminosarum TaxID=384 RepID=UPI00144255BA|nr:peroxiredoxin-like family protein [Rhizobium leguminosarum]NKL02741.1 redoxin domain-containing protein [Rhizobium leguminosarum bv. viciae]
MGLEQQLADFNAKFEASAPTGAAAFLNSKIEELTAGFPLVRVPKPGDLAPEFSLPGVAGETISLLETLARGPVVLTFYRGAWCPYCNIQLAAYQRVLPALAEAGGSLIAVSPQKPDGSLSMTEKNNLTFDVLSDTGNVVARKFGLVYKLPDDLKAAYSSFSVDLAAINGDDSWELPIPATFVIGRNGRVQLAHAEADYRKRLAPEAIVDALRAAEGA